MIETRKEGDLMSMQNFEPIQYSNDREKGDTGYAFFIFFGLLTIGIVISGIYFILLSNNWWLMFLFGPGAIIFGLFAYLFYPSEKTNVYSYKLNENELYQQWINKKTKQMIERVIPLSEVEKVLIGLYAHRIPTDNSTFYRFNALLIIIHNDNYFFEWLLSVDELQKWIKQLEGKVPVIQYTDNDLSEAFLARTYTAVDFSTIEGSTIDIVSDHVGKETYRNYLTVWMPEEIEIQVKEAKKIETLPITRRAEKRTLWIVFIYNLLFSTFVFLGLPVDTDGYIAISDNALLTYLGVNLLIPCLFIFWFWRRFTKWFNPVLLTFASITGNLVGTFFVSLIKNLPIMYESIIVLNIFNLFLWICAMVIINSFKFIAKFPIKYDL